MKITKGSQRMKNRNVVTMLMALLLFCACGAANAEPVSPPRAAAQATTLDPQRISDLSNNLLTQYKLAEAISQLAVQKLQNSSDALEQYNCMKSIGHAIKAASLIKATAGMLGVRSLDATAITAGINTTADQLAQANVNRDSTRQFLLEDSEATVALVEAQLKLAQDYLAKTGP